MNKKTEDLSQSNAMNRKGSQIGEEKVLKIDPEIKFLAPQLDREAYALLERNLRDKGCINPIICWDGRNTIIDGHNRHEICTKHGIKYDTIQMHFETKEEVMNFVIDHQLGRRNLSDLEKSYLRGKRYLTEKKAAHRPASAELHQDDGVKGETAKKIGEKTGVGQATIERDAVLAEAIDKLREKIGEEFSKRLRSGNVKISKKDTVALSNKEPGVMKSLVDLIEKGKKLSQAEEFLGIQTDSSPKPVNEDKYFEKIDMLFHQVLRILDQLKATEQLDRVVRLYERSQTICNMLNKIGAKTPDSSTQNEVDASGKSPESNNPGTQDGNPESIPHSEEGVEDEAAGSESIESNPFDSMDESTKMPEGWEEYEEAMEKEENSKD